MLEDLRGYVRGPERQPTMTFPEVREFDDTLRPRAASEKR
jgi:hypothetical protein